MVSAIYMSDSFGDILSTKSFLLALRKLLAIRSKTRTILSGSAKNFILSKDTIKKIQSNIAEEEVEWNLIPK